MHTPENAIIKHYGKAQKHILNERSQLQKFTYCNDSSIYMKIPEQVNS
jgi:hypothetical protein